MLKICISLIETWDVLKFASIIIMLFLGGGLIETWDVLKLHFFERIRL